MAAGCGPEPSPYMAPAVPRPFTAGNDSSVVVFVVSDQVGESHDRVVDEHLRFVADLDSKSFVVTNQSPGEHSFYVTNNDYAPVLVVHAKLAPGKTYFVNVALGATRRDSIGWYCRQSWVSKLTRLKAIDARGAQREVDIDRPLYAATASKLERAFVNLPPKARKGSILRPDDGE
jgi:hypothetical protein